MRELPPILVKAYTEELVALGLSQRDQGAWKRWARFYIDFSLKYKHPPRSGATLPKFQKKLASKGQGEEKRAEAGRAIVVLLKVLSRFAEPTGAAEQEAGSKVEEDPGDYLVGGLPERRRSGRSARSTQRGETGHSEGGSADGSREVGEGANPGAGSWVEEYEALANAFAIGQYAPTTRRSYTHWVRQFQGFLRSASPSGIGSEDAAAFLTYIAREKGVAAATQNQAFNALLFFYRHVLGKDFKPDGVERARKTKYVPQTLTRAEIDEVAGLMPTPYSLLVRVLYGCGLRLTEALETRVHNFDFDLGLLTIHRGKGEKDRTVPLPEVLLPEFKEHLSKVRAQFAKDKAAGFAGAFMPKRGSQKNWDRRALDWQWQYFFPAARLTRVEKGEEQEWRRYHLHATRFSMLLRKAVTKTGIHKKVSAHTFRHSFASHLVMANFDIKTVQEMLGHSDIRTTMIYLQTVPARTKKDRRSPLDLPPGELG